MKTTEELEKELAEMRAFNKELERQIEKAEEVLKDLKTQNLRLIGYWKDVGNIARKKQEIEDSKLVLLCVDGWKKNVRLVKSTPKRYYFKYDGIGEREFFYDKDKTPADLLSALIEKGLA